MIPITALSSIKLTLHIQNKPVNEPINEPVNEPVNDNSKPFFLQRNKIHP
jgi:hypothetical protein